MQLSETWPIDRKEKKSKQLWGRVCTGCRAGSGPPVSGGGDQIITDRQGITLKIYSKHVFSFGEGGAVAYDRLDYMFISYIIYLFLG